MIVKSAKSSKPTSPKLILFFVYPGIKLLDLTGPLQVFSDAVDESTGDRAYRAIVGSLSGGEVASDTGLSISTEPCSQWSNHSDFTLIVVGGDGSRAAANDSAVTDFISKLSKQAHRVASVCTGAFVLAASKILDGRRAVTHWQHCNELAVRHPAIRIESDPIYIKDGHVWTSAGVTAGIDMALAMVKEDFGRQAALSLARSLVTYVIRPGGQSQFSVALGRQATAQSERFEKLHTYIADNLDKDLRVEELAARASMSPRNFSRIYTAETGTTPAKAVEAVRTEVAQHMLENTDLSIARVADSCGFGDIERMRRAFMKILKVSPSEYRQRFRLSIN